ncbi:MAG: type II secretion system F family protein, partial [Candidatus Spechtbacterales bacterium]
REGGQQKGRVEARDPDAAADILQSHDLVILSLRPESATPIFSRELKLFRRVNTKDLAAFSRQLSVLFQSDVPLVESLNTLALQTTSEYLKDALRDVASSVDSGTSFSDSLARYEDIFSNFYVQMVKAGEVSGKLDEVLTYLADHTERTYYTNSKIKGAMAYPAFVLVAFTFIGAGMLIFVVPQLTSMLTQSGAELPLITRIIIGLSTFLQTFWYAILALIGGGGFGLWQFLKTPDGVAFWDKLQLDIPVFGRIFSNVYIYRFTESLAMLIRGGVPITDALSISGNIVGNTVYKKMIHEARDRVVQGEEIAPVLNNYPEMPKLVTQMISVGEQTGKLEGILDNVSKFYEQEVATSVDSITSLIEPILIVMLGLGVMALVLGILLPIYNTVNTF